jgi:transposase
MGTKSTRYSEEFKENIISLHQNGKKVSELVIEYGVSKAAINSWIRDIKEIPTDNGTITPLELRKLQAKIRNLEEENDILKKAITIFAKK